MQSGNEVMNVYFYALYEAADQTAHSGMCVERCAEIVMEEIQGNYIQPRCVTIRRIPELLGLVNDEACTVEILPRKEALARIRFSLED